MFRECDHFYIAHSTVFSVCCFSHKSRNKKYLNLCICSVMLIRQVNQYPLSHTNGSIDRRDADYSTIE